jgi:hypothetical protein
MKRFFLPILLSAGCFTLSFSQSAAPQGGMQASERSAAWNLITDTPEEGFQLAIRLARKGVTETQRDREVLFRLRDVYTQDADALIAVSQVIAIHFQTIAAANNYWREK